MTFQIFWCNPDECSKVGCHPWLAWVAIKCPVALGTGSISPNFSHKATAIRLLNPQLVITSLDLDEAFIPIVFTPRILDDALQILSEYYHQDLSPEMVPSSLLFMQVRHKLPINFLWYMYTFSSALRIRNCVSCIPSTKIHFLYSVLKVFSLPLEKKFEKKISFLDISHMLCYTLFCEIATWKRRQISWEMNGSNCTLSDFA